MVTPRQVGRFAPVRFVLFLAAFAVTTVMMTAWRSWPGAVMIGFDVAAFLFLVSCLPLLNDTTEQIRRHAEENAANRVLLLILSVAVTAVIFVAVGVELIRSRNAAGPPIALVLTTLALAWLFANVIYALHYAHVYYERRERGIDFGGIEFPHTAEPSYIEFIYFAFTVGMTFQTSDAVITCTRIRQVVIGHGVAGFVFNIGVLAFTINVLGGH